MIGILLLSHGKVAEGLLDTLKMFFGNDLSQVTSICFAGTEAVEELDQKIAKAIEQTDDGHGIIAFCDIAGGTPFNRCAFKVSERFQVISGMNVGMVMEFLGNRTEDLDIKDVDIQQLISAGQSMIISLNERLNKRKKEVSE